MLIPYVKVIKIKDYISNHHEANEVFTIFDKIRYLIKKDTGLGGTSSIMKITDKNVVIVTSTTGIIKDKENHKADNHLFIYGGSKDTWKDVETHLHSGLQFILTITFDQLTICKDKRPYLYDKIVNINFFIDEFQVFAEAEYRKTASQAYHQIFTDLKVPYVLSTATPTYDLLDIPPHIKPLIEIIGIELEEPRKKTLNIMPEQACYTNIKKYFLRGEKSLLFTNELKKYKNIIGKGRLGDHTQILVGDKLAVGTSTIKSKTLEEQEYLEKGIVDYTKDIFMLSTTYSIGFDFKEPCNIGICVNQLNQAECKYINDIDQSYGRGRGDILEGNVYYNEAPFQPSAERSAEMVAEAIKGIHNTPFDADYLSKIQPMIRVVNESLTFPRVNLIKNLKLRGYEVNDVYFKIEKEDGPKYNLRDKILEVYSQPLDITAKQINIIANNVNGDDDDSHGYGGVQMLAHAYAYLAKYTDSSYLMTAIPNKYSETLRRLKTFLDVNDLAYPDEYTVLKNHWTTKKQQDLAIKRGAICEILSYTRDITFQDGEVLKAKHMVEALYVINGVKLVKEEIYKEGYPYIIVKDGKEKIIKCPEGEGVDFIWTIPQKSLIPENGQRIMKGFAAVHDIYLKAFLNGLTKSSGEDVAMLIATKNKTKLTEISFKPSYIEKFFSNSGRDLDVKLEGLNLTVQEREQVLKKANDIKGSLKKCEKGIYAAYKSNNYSLRKQVQNHNTMLMFDLSSLIGNHVAGFKISTIDDRQFNPITKTTRQLRDLTPYDMTTFDIDSEFATFVDRMIGSQIKDEVYSNIMKAYGWDIPVDGETSKEKASREKAGRDKAKTLYNKTVNSWFLPIPELTRTLRKFGYSKEEADKLVGIIRQGSGSFYRMMTPLEKAAIEEFVKENKIKHYTRIHDAVRFINLTPNKKFITQFGNLSFSRVGAPKEDKNTKLFNLLKANSDNKLKSVDTGIINTPVTQQPIKPIYVAVEPKKDIIIEGIKVSTTMKERHQKAYDIINETTVNYGTRSGKEIPLKDVDLKGLVHIVSHWKYCSTLNFGEDGIEDIIENQTNKDYIIRFLKDRGYRFEITYSNEVGKPVEGEFIKRHHEWKITIIR